MQQIADSFCGYLKIDEDVFAYSVSNNIVTLLPAYSEPTKQHEAFHRICLRNTNMPEFYYGSVGCNSITMLRNGKIHTDFLGLNLSALFGTPLIIQAAGNGVGYFNMLTDRWDNFHAITFIGGNINPICNPEIAVETSTFNELSMVDGAKTVRLRPWKDYTRTVDFQVEGEKVTCTVSVSQSGGKSLNNQMNAYSLGELNSYIRFSFESSQSVARVERYYKIAHSLISILTGQRNVTFQTYLSQRNAENKYFESAICKISNSFENFSQRHRYYTINIFGIFDYFQNLLEIIAKNELDIILALLPDDNRKVNQISITNVQDLCTALETAYEWRFQGEKRKKDELIEELKKEIKKTISCFNEQHKSEIDVYAATTISSSFQYLSYTLADKIYTLYNENKQIIDAVVSKLSLPSIDKDSIKSFVKIRNNKTHRGITEWGDSVSIYPALLALLYSCLLKRIDVPDSTIQTIVLNFF